MLVRSAEQMTHRGRVFFFIDGVCFVGDLVGDFGIFFWCFWTLQVCFIVGHFFHMHAGGLRKSPWGGVCVCCLCDSFKLQHLTAAVRMSVHEWPSPALSKNSFFLCQNPFFFTNLRKNT